jgi:hypothetical protein
MKSQPGNAQGPMSPVLCEPGLRGQAGSQVSVMKQVLTSSFDSLALWMTLNLIDNCLWLLSQNLRGPAVGEGEQLPGLA